MRYRACATWSAATSLPQSRPRNTKIDAKFDAMESKINTLRTMIAWGLAAIGPLVAALRLFA